MIDLIAITEGASNAGDVPLGSQDICARIGCHIVRWAHEDEYEREKRGACHQFLETKSSTQSAYTAGRSRATRYGG